MIHIHLDTVDSTQDYAKSHVGEFVPDRITCVTADEQTKGRGRFQRKWVSPRGVNLYATFYFRIPSHTLHLVSLAQLMTYSFASLLAREGLEPKIKWPNDVLLNRKKVSGILCETVFHRDFVDIFLGIGINVNMDASALSGIELPASSLKKETGRDWEIKGLLKKLYKQFEEDLNRFKKEGFTPFHKGFEDLLILKGEQIRYFDGKKEWIGRLQSLTADGQLTLLLPDGMLHTVSSGEIRH